MHGSIVRIRQFHIIVVVVVVVIVVIIGVVIVVDIVGEDADEVVD